LKNSGTNSGKDMSVNSWSVAAGAVIEQWTPLGRDNQVFNIQNTPEGYKILPSYNEKALSVEDGSQANGAIIRQLADEELLSQRFSFIEVGDG